MESTIDRFEIKRELYAQTPMIHFQYGENGATLRASEVKPKLDCYLKTVLVNNDPELKEDKKLFRRKYGKYLLQKDAFNYTMKIYINNLNRNNMEDISWGGKGIKKESLIMFDCTIKILCFYPKLKQLIEDNIDDFFDIYNFGKLQSKASGGFTTRENTIDTLTDDDIKKIGKNLLNVSGGKTYYYLNNIKLEDAYAFMSAFCYDMKSDDYSLKYLNDKHLNTNDEYEALYDVLNRCQNHEQVQLYDYVDDYVFYRALLGLPCSIELSNNKDEKFNVKADKVNKKIQRYHSTVYFKYIHNCLFIVARKIPKEMYGSSFVMSFNKKSKYRGSIVLKTPKNKNEFNVDEYLDYFVDLYNKNNSLDIKKGSKL